MNVLSLFDGISCGQIALKRAGIKVNNYYASEIDKYAMKVTQENYPNTIQLGDIKNINGKDFPKIDLLIGGSPCQGFSMAGKQLNFEDPRSKLFFEFVRLLKETKPKYFLLENVRMKKEYQDIISKYLGVEPILINSSLVSAQNRKRLYWGNIPNITQPQDKHIYLKDIIETGVVNRDKSYCIDANYYKGGKLEQYFKKSRRRVVFEKPKRITSYGNGGQGDAKTGLYCIAQRGRYNKEGKIIQRFEPRFDGKTNSLTTVQKDNYLLENYIVRKLTPIECERLQTLEDNYTEGISNSQRYKCLGNGWTIDIIAHIFKGLIRKEQNA